MKNTGITLIALIITIIVMLILAGVTVSLIIGDNGIFTNAVETEKEYSKTTVAESLDLLVYSEFLNAWAKVSSDEVDADVSEYFNEKIMLAYLTGTNDNNIEYMEGEGTSTTITDASGTGTIDVYEVYIIKASTVSESVTKYGLGTSTDDGDVFTLEVQTDQNGASTGEYNVYYYDNDGDTITKSKALTTINLYITSTDS